MRTRARAADPVGLDVPYVAEAFELPEDEVRTLLDAPTTELVQAFLQSVSLKAHDYDTLKADKLRVDVELENTVRTSESKARAQKAQLAKHAKEVEELRIKLNEADAAREGLAFELEQLQSSTSGSTAETLLLRQRIETLESSNRDALALVENKSTEKDHLVNELSESHGKLLALRREVNALEEKNQSLENAASSQKFKEQSLQQEIDLLKRNNEWSSNELQTRSQEHAKFRKERNARIASLQRELEDANASADALKRAETTLRQRLEEVQAKADEAFARIATLQEEFARKQQDMRTEIDSTKRLADLQAQSAATHKARLHDVHGQIDQVKEDAAEEIGRLQAEIETERSDKETAERKVAELEIAVERMEHSRATASRPGTPVRNGGWEPSTPARFGSRAGSPIPGSARKVVGGLTFTQLYSKYTEMQGDLEGEKRRTSRLSTAMDEMITELEGRQPEILELRNEHERLEAEVLDFSRLLDESTATREAAVKESQRWQGQTEAAAREGEILRQQLRDLAAQVKILLVEIQSRDQGLGEMSAQERLDLERAAHGELGEDGFGGLSSTGRLISERLVIFRGVAALQERNEELLRLTRSLGEQMEGEEAREKARQSAADAEEVETLRLQVERYKDELQATATQIDSYMKERDMFRRMLQHRGQLAPDTGLQSLFGQSMGPPATPGRNSQIEPATPRSKDAEDLNKLLREQQTFFDQYRTESSTDRRRLKDQVDTLSRDKSSFQADLARAQSQLQLAAERHAMLQQNYNALRSENQELQKRSRDVYEQLTKQESRTNQVTEDLVEARSMADSLRNENANAKAEKELWKRIEARLTDDNKNLMDERSRLNKLVTDLQNLQNERELSESETRRRLQSRVDVLESELGDAKRKAEDASEEYKRLSQRREYEEGERRKREDDLTKALSNVREELVAAKTTRDQLQGRIDEIKIDLQSAEEKVQALQPRPTPRAEPTQDVHQNGQREFADEDLSVEQRLALELSELRRDFELTKNELEAARQQVEQYRSISQATEEELAAFNETSEQYKEETDRLIMEKDTTAKQLEQRLEDAGAELTMSNIELSELRTKQEESTHALEAQKAGFESELVRLRDDADRYGEEKKLYQEDLKAQAAIAQQAQQSYEDELVKHAEAAKNLQHVRKDYHDLRAEVASFKAEADAAKASLERGEESWSEQKERYQKEMDELQARKVDLDGQNRLLHQQMEKFSNELQSLRQGRSLPAQVLAGEDAEAQDGSPSKTGNESLQEVIRYLRREKEIVDVQHELSVQEGKRLQQQLDYANGQLEEVRQKLAVERRQTTDRLASESSTSKLMEEIKQLNLYRESNEQLRSNLRQTEEKLAASRAEIERLLADIDPMKARMGELEGELEGRDDRLQLLERDRDHWRERTQNIISKYDRVDPAELDEMRKQIAELQAERERLHSEKEAVEGEQGPLREQIEAFEQRLEAQKQESSDLMNERLMKFKDQAKEQNRKQNTKITDANKAADDAKAESTRVTAELDTVRAELEQAKSARDAALTSARSISSQHQQQREASAEEGQVNEDEGNSEEHAQLHARIAEAEMAASEHATRAEALDREVQSLQARVHELEHQVSSLGQQLGAAQGNAETLGTAQSQAEPALPSENTEVLEKLQQELLDAQKEVETLRSSAVVASTAMPTSTSDQQRTDAQPLEGETSIAEQVAEEVAKLRMQLEQQHELSKKQMEEQFDKRATGLKEKLNFRLRDEKEKIRGELAAQHSEELQKLRDEHETAVQKLKADHTAELERLTQEGATAVQQKSEQPDEVSTGETGVKAEQSASEIDVTKLDFTKLDASHAQAMDFVKSNATIKAIVSSNIKKQTEILKTQIAQKDDEIAKLQADRPLVPTETTPSGGEANDGTAEQLQALTAERDDLAKKLETVQAQLKAAEQRATQTEMKFKLLTTARDKANAKVEAVKKAAKDTPDKSVKEAWELAEKAQPVTRPVATPSKPTAVPLSPAQTFVSQLQSGNIVVQQPAGDTEKLRERQERFGAIASSPTTQTAGLASVGSASGNANALLGKGTFGQPSAGSFGQPSQPESASPNPQAPVFTPGSSASAAQPNSEPAPQNANTGPTAPRSGIQTGIPQPGGASKLPRGGGQVGRGGSQGIAVQGGANHGAGQRGGAQSSLPRGGASQIGRGGRGGARGSAGANAGQKRQHDGSDGGGDSKRTRGGGSGGA